MEQKRRKQQKQGIFLLVWPAASLILSFLLFAAINVMLRDADAADVDGIRTVLNVFLFAIGALAVGLGLPSMIVGIIRLATLPQPNSDNTQPPSQAPVSAVAGQAQHLPQQHQQSGLAITSMILGIVSVVLGIVGFVPGLLAVIFGALSIRKPNSKGLALAGIISGSVGILISVVTLLILAAN